MTDDIPTGNEKKSFLAGLMRPKVAITLFLLFLLLISPLLIRSWYLRGVPDLPEPFDAEPLLSLKVSAADNAFTDYRAAEAVYTQPEFEVDELRDEVLRHGWHLANDEIRQFLHDNESAMLAWKQGTEKDRALHIPAKDYHAQVDLQLIRRMREFHRTAMLLCLQLEAEGKPQAAWEWYRAAIRSSRHVGTGGVPVERVIGASLFRRMSFQLENWAADPRLTSDDLRLALDQLQQDWKLTEQTSNVLQINYLALSRSMQEQPERLVQVGGLEPSVAPHLYYFVGEPELSDRLMRFHFHNHLQFSDLPRYQRPQMTPREGLFDDPAGLTIDDVEWSLPDYRSASQRSVIMRGLFGATQQFYLRLDQEEVMYRTTLVMLAGQAFYRDRGVFPATLDELVPEYLDRIPIDNFDGLPLKYRFDPAGPVVYSVFEDQTDDGGWKWTYDRQSLVRSLPDDFGSQMRLPDLKPLAAPKP